MEQTTDVIEKSIDTELRGYLEKAKEIGASDIHFAPGSRAMVRMHGVLKPLDDQVFMPPELERMATSMLREDQKKH
ncbi:MAG: hypothetical protein K5840_07165, partial [Eubacterium sp.]|nr:hypothetical protein [Eubacterium sp.]